MFTSVPLVAQVVKDESALAASPAAINADKVRSVGGKFETIYGQELVSTTALTGVCRGVFTWADLTRAAWASFGTSQRLQVMDQDGGITNATPIIERGQLTNPFTTTLNSITISVVDDAHGLVADQLVSFSTTSAASITIAGPYTVSSVASSSVYAFNATSSANQSTASVGGTVDYEYSLAPGNVNNLGGYGYGTGGFGSGGYGAASTGVVLDARTWSFTNWGQNLIANPVWGAIYELAPNVSAPEIVNTGDFGSTGTWVYGSGWSLGSGTSSATNGAKLSQSVSLVKSSWHLLRFDITANSGTIQPLIGTTNVGAAITTTQTVKRTFFSPSSTAQTLIFDGSSAFNGRIDNVSLKVLTVANIIPNAPTSVGSVFVTAERNLVACGSTAPSTSSLDPMRVAWSASENNQDWTASAANVAGSYTLSHGSRIIRGLEANRENLIWTDTALYRMRSVPDPSVVYAFDLIAEGCGLLGPNAAVVANGVAYWASQYGGFYAYAGGQVLKIPCPNERDYRDNLADVQGAKVYAAHLSAQSEIWWFYPDERDGIECSRYLVFDYEDKTWVTGYYDRTAYTDAGIFRFPIATKSTGEVFYQEKDFSNDGSARSTTLESAYFNFGDGENLFSVMGFRPDFDDLRGGVSLTLYSKLYPQDTTERTYGPYSITAATKRLSLRVKGRQVRFKLTTTDAPSFYRLGAMTFDVKASGEKD